MLLFAGEAFQNQAEEPRFSTADKGPTQVSAALPAEREAPRKTPKPTVPADGLTGLYRSRRTTEAADFVGNLRRVYALVLVAAIDRDSLSGVGDDIAASKATQRCG